MQTNRPKNGALGFLACALAGTFWGCGFFFGKIALAEMSVGHMVFYRFFFAVLGLMPLIVTRRPRFGAKGWRTLMVGALLGVPVQFLLQFRALSMTTVDRKSVV